MISFKILKAIGCCLIAIIAGIGIVSVMPYQTGNDVYANITNTIPLLGWACIILGFIGIFVSIKWIK